MNLKIDPEFESKIPPLTEEEFQQLEENILSDGVVLNPIIVWNGIIVDGHNRFRIIQKHPDLAYTTKEMEFADRNAVNAWICRNQLGRRNLTPAQKKYLIGKQYEAEKASHGASDGFRGNQHSDVVTGQNDHLAAMTTRERIARETNTSDSYVRRAEHFAKNVDMAEDIQPGFRTKIFSGEIKPTDKSLAEIPAAAPEERAARVEEMLLPPPTDKQREKKTRKPHSETAELAVIQDIADAMLEPRNNGVPSTMVYEMNDAMESIIYRWNFCHKNYTQFFDLEECLTAIDGLIDQGIAFLTEYRQVIASHRNATADSTDENRKDINDNA